MGQFASIDGYFRRFRRRYSQLIGHRISRTPLKSLLVPVKNILNAVFPTPAAVMIGVTSKCQARCAHCGMALYRDKHKEELSTRDILSLLDNAAKLGVRRAYYFGGEPLLRSDILELIGHGNKLGLKNRLDTNGYLLSEKMVRDLKQFGVDRIGVSLDDPDPERHNELRGMAGLFEKAISGIKHCVRQNLYCYISTYATKESVNNGKLRAMIDFAKSLQVDHIRILFPACAGKLLKMPEIRLGSREKHEILRMAGDPNFVFLEEGVSNRLDEGYCSSLQKSFIYISWHGDVQPCPFVPLSFGDIRSEPLTEIIRRMWKHPLYSLAADDCIMNNDLFRDQYVSEIDASPNLPVMASSELPRP